jgi:3-oxoisoapionate decarboxylase
MRLGIGTYTFMWSIGIEGARPAAPMTARALAEKARELHVGVVQYGPNLPVTLEDLAPARDMGLEIEIGVAGLAIRESVRFARAAGASLLRTVLPYEAAEAPPASEIEQGLRALVPVLEAEDMRLGLENSVTPAATLKAVLESVGSSRVGITLDTANSIVIGESWRHVLEALAPHVVCLHLKDYTIRREWHRMGFRLTGAPAGKGAVDVPYLLNSLQAAGARFNTVLELWPPEQAALDETIALEHAWARESVAYLRTLITE